MGCQDHSEARVEGLQGKPVTEICTEPQSSQAQDSQGRDQVLAPAAEAVEVPEQRPHWEPGATKTGLSTSERSRLPIRSGALGAAGRTCALSSRRPCINSGYCG